METSNYERFRQLHYSNQAFLLPNVWDVGSALVFQEKGFQAVGTSSAAIASALGHRDGEEMSFDELCYIVAGICNRTDLLVSVDIEGGYSRDAAAICENIERLAKIGVVGINIEDSVVSGKRSLADADAFAETVRKIKTFCTKERLEIFVNLRTDTYLLNVEERLSETERRIKLYENAGADGIFIPCLTDLAEMEKLCSTTDLPINVMCMPDLPDFEALGKAGVKRISMGNFLYEVLKKRQAEITDQILSEKSFNAIF